MKIHVKRLPFDDYTEYSVSYNEATFTATLPFQESEVTDEMEGKILRYLKHKVAEELEKEIQFEITTIEAKRPDKGNTKG